MTKDSTTSEQSKDMISPTLRLKQSLEGHLGVLELTTSFLRIIEDWELEKFIKMDDLAIHLEQKLLESQTIFDSPNA